MPYPRRHALCTCGHNYENHDDNLECTKCAEGYCPHGYDESREQMAIELILPTEEEYTKLCDAVKKFAVVREVYLK